jgi:polyhydroxybutyrate depolymerase
VAFWLEQRKCETAASTAEGVAMRTGHCADDSAVAVYELPEMGHAWPGGSGGMGYAPSPVSATDLIWTFFRDHPRP